MKKLLAYLFLLLHINAAMFFPAVEEKDLFDKKGNQIEDVNSLAEFVFQKIFALTPDTPIDEDDDQPDFSHSVKFSNYFLQEQVLSINTFSSANNKHHTQYNHQLTYFVDEEHSPPPEVA